jgi:hypothetical protein
MPKVISADKKACIKRSFGEYKKDRPDFTNEQIFERLLRIFEVISFFLYENYIVIFCCRSVEIQ